MVDEESLDVGIRAGVLAQLVLPVQAAKGGGDGMGWDGMGRDGMGWDGMGW